MAFSRNKSQHNNSATPMSEKHMNDSLRAAQIIFQKHSDQTGQSTPTTPSTTGNNPGNPNNIRRGSSQLTPAKVAATAVRNRTVTPPPNNSNGTVSNAHTSSPPSEHAHLAALLAHATLNPDNNDESSNGIYACNQNNSSNYINNNISNSNMESDKVSPIAGKQRQSNSVPNHYLAHLYRAPSPRNNSNTNIGSTVNDDHTILARSFEDLPKLETTKDSTSPIPRGLVNATPSKSNLLSTSGLNATPKLNSTININFSKHHNSEQSLASPNVRTPIEAQKQPLRQPVEQVRPQLKEAHRQPWQQTQQHQQQQLQSPQRPPPIHREMSTPTHLPQRNLKSQTQSSNHNYQHSEERSPSESHAQLQPHFYSSPAVSSELSNHSVITTPTSQEPNYPIQNQQQSEMQLQKSPAKPVLRTLNGRVPPPKIYLGLSGEEEGATDFGVDNDTDTTSEKPIFRTKIKRRPRRALNGSSSSIISSESPMSYGLESSSLEDPRLTAVDNFDEDSDDEVEENNEINADEHDDYDDYDDYEYDDDIEDGEAVEEHSLPPKIKATPYDRSCNYQDTASLPNLDNVSTSISTYGGAPPVTAKPKRSTAQPKVARTYKSITKTPQSQSQTQKKPQQTPSPYHSPQQQPQQQPANVTYQGTLPDLIPNHIRRTKMEKLKTKIFGSSNGKKKSSPFDLPSDRTSITADPEGRAVVKTNQNMKFKTTMRKDMYGGSYNTGESSDQRSDLNEYGGNEFNDDSDEDSDSSLEQQKEEKRNRNRGMGIRKKLKNTASVVPYSDHLLHIDNRHAPKIFNEDKPWKSHNDVGFVTPQERKRYEGMWVSNRCMYLDLLPWWAAVLDGDSDINVQLPDDGLILNLVVKDIWSRSNLSEDLLVHIYDMVDTRKDGTLDRKSFVVGMWIVDQCLYGRKLPKEIDQKVWDSVDKYVVSTTNFANLRHLDRNKKKQMRQEIKNIKKDIKNVHS